MSNHANVSTAARLTRRRALAVGVSLLAGCSSPRDASRPVGGGHGVSDGDAHLGFVGDVMFGRGVDAAQSQPGRAPDAVWGDVRPRLDALDGLLLNLECCLSTRGERTPHRGYYFRADPAWAVPALRAANAAWVGLANNHVLDFGEVALGDTLSALDGADIPFAGAGEDRRAAFSPARFRVGGLDVAAVAVTDRAPAYAAGAIRPGTAYLPLSGDPYSRLALTRALRDARDADPDLLVVSLHWGPNWVTRPAARYRRLARWLVDAGADVVHGHSAHVPQGIEVYRGRPILHDAGDFVDDYALVGDLHNDRSFLFEVVVEDGRLAELGLHPVVIRDRAVFHADSDAAAWLRDRMRARSAEFDTSFRREGEELVRELSPQP